MDSISPVPLSRCTSIAAAMIVSVSPVAFWNNGCIGSEVKEEETERTEILISLCFLCLLLFKSGRSLTGDDRDNRGINTVWKSKELVHNGPAKVRPIGLPVTYA